MNKAPLILCFGLLTNLAVSSLAGAQPPEAQAFLEARNARANRVLAREPSEARTDELTTILNGLLDYDALSEAALADHWESHSEEERTAFVTLLRQLVERSYRSNLERTLNFEVEYTGAAPRGGQVVVQSMARSRSNRRAPPISIDYTMSKTGRNWRVVDITTDGQSLVQGYRAQFHRIIERDGWDGLMRRMQDRLNR